MKLILQILFLIFIVATFFVCTVKPELHKTVIVYNSDYTLVTEEEVKTETKEIPITEKVTTPNIKTTVSENNVIPKQNTIKAVETKSIKNVQKPVTQRVTNSQKTEATKDTKTVTKDVLVPKQNSSVKKEEIVPQKITEQKKELQKEVKQIPKTLTQQEETIAWNKWRSVLTNQIMQDTKLPKLPNGVLFKFSFTVDKFGKITNVQTGADPSNYTPYAIQYIAPVIRSYQGRSILEFPEGTLRTTTDVTGKWRISDTQKYSTPQDYNDIEKIKY